jgi:hypothetical protein
VFDPPWPPELMSLSSGPLYGANLCQRSSKDWPKLPVPEVSEIKLSTVSRMMSFENSTTPCESVIVRWACGLPKNCATFGGVSCQVPWSVVTPAEVVIVALNVPSALNVGTKLVVALEGGACFLRSAPPASCRPRGSRCA